MKTENLTLQQAYEALKKGYRVKLYDLEAHIKRKNDADVLCWNLGGNEVIATSNTLNGWEIIQDEPREFIIQAEYKDTGHGMGSRKLTPVAYSKGKTNVFTPGESLSVVEKREGEILLSREKFREAWYKLKDERNGEPFHIETLIKKLFGGGVSE